MTAPGDGEHTPKARPPYEAPSWQQLFCYALSRCRHEQVSEDFAQEASIEIFEGRQTSMSNLWVDFVRKTLGTNSGNEARDRARLDAHFGSRARWEGDKNDVEQVSAKKAAEPIDLRDRGLLGLTQIERVCVVLMNTWGFTQREVANVLGLTEGRISQLLRALGKRIRERQST